MTDDSPDRRAEAIHMFEDMKSKIAETNQRKRRRCKSFGKINTILFYIKKIILSIPMIRFIPGCLHFQISTVHVVTLLE